MRKLLLTMLASCATLGLSCAPQTDSNRNGNLANVNSTPAVKASPASTDDVADLRAEFEEESTAVIRVVNRQGSPTPSTVPCEITIDRPRIQLYSSADPDKTKVQWRVKHDCDKAPDRPISVKVMFDSAGAFGPDPCDNRLFLDFVEKGKRKRVVSRTANSAPGRYKYTVSAFLVNEGGAEEKIAPDLDPEIEIGGLMLSRRK